MKLIQIYCKHCSIRILSTRFHQFELSFQLYYALAKYNILDLEELQILETKCYEINSNILQTVLNKNIIQFHQFLMNFCIIFLLCFN